jgi:pSer/pThr/pTyr-binding forkhead associated (FHA) protein
VIEKDTYIVGRSPSKTDITIADSNISSRHAQVVRKNGQYFLEDLASTNGVHFKGELIKSRAIEEGDVFHLCEHELRFVFT